MPTHVAKLVLTEELPASQARVIEGHDHGEVLLDVERKLPSGETVWLRSTCLGLVVVNADQFRHRVQHQCLKIRSDFVDNASNPFQGSVQA